MVERTLAVIRAEAVKLRQVGHIRRHILAAGFEIATQQKIKAIGSEAEAFISSIDANDGSALVLEKDNAVADWLALIPVIQESDKDHLPENSLYGSSAEDAVTELGHLFPKYRPVAAVTTQDIPVDDSALVTFGNPDEGTLKQIYTCMSVGNVAGAVLCGDAHIGYAQPVGGVVAYPDMVSISGNGYDIGCGNGAVKTNIPFGAVKNRVGQLLKDISQQVSFGLGRVRTKGFDHPLLEDVDAWRAADVEVIDGKDMRKLTESQFYTCGTSNHYVDLMVELPAGGQTDLDRQPVWIGVHFGSRGLGFKSATKYLKLAGGKDNMFGPPTVVRVNSELGQRYIAAMELSGRFANANRLAVMDAIRRILGAREVELIHNHHNYSFLEEHDGQKLWVVRKGATPAFPGQRGFVGGSMGDDAVIIEGVDSEKSRASFYSTIHGAGRVMSRGEAKRTFTRHQMQEWLHKRGVTLVGGGVDESPMSYRRLDDVLKHHEGTIKVIHRLRPFGVMMAGDDDRKRDPYHE